ncbi:MAG: copper resistance protein CopC [Acidimicrobiales bacterium]|nr:copper resistance protein CopC [Acidimicrobiales bacterium]
MARRRAAGIVAAVVTLMVLLAAPHARAHTEVQRAAPGPGEVVVGPIDDVRLQFLDPVLPRVRISVRTPEGDVVSGLEAVEHSDDGRTATVGFDALTAAGDYVVEYDFVALDGDSQTDGYRFSIVPSEAEGGRSVLGPVALGVVSVVLVGALILAIRRRSVADS